MAYFTDNLNFTGSSNLNSEVKIKNVELSEHSIKVCRIMESSESLAITSLTATREKAGIEMAHTCNLRNMIKTKLDFSRLKCSYRKTFFHLQIAYKT